MPVIDLTHLICEGMPSYPGVEGPSLRVANTYEKDGFLETMLRMTSHTGTHMDAPAHLFEGHSTLDSLPADRFVGKAKVINATHRGASEYITMEDLMASGEDDVRAADFLLFRTGWDEKWGTDEYFGDYPVLDMEVTDFIAKGTYRGVGFDVIGIDPIANEALTRHRALFGERDMVIIENLCRLGEADEAARGGLFTLIAAPLKFQNADGAPIRALALV
ncbi:MAG: cyclase family protein [Clostridia bacterium]|nr:cyclase family protein [Clostridia bacterium]